MGIRFLIRVRNMKTVFGIHCVIKMTGWQMQEIKNRPIPHREKNFHL